ncbi:MAG: WG repeat-containing protein [Chitinophagaceae bacterium]
MKYRLSATYLFAMSLMLLLPGAGLHAQEKTIFEKDGWYGVKDSRGYAIYVQPVMTSISKHGYSNNDFLCEYNKKYYVLTIKDNSSLTYISYCTNCGGTGYTTIQKSAYDDVGKEKTYTYNAKDATDFKNGTTSKVTVTYKDSYHVKASSEKVICPVCRNTSEKAVAFTWTGSENIFKTPSYKKPATPVITSPYNFTGKYKDGLADVAIEDRDLRHTKWGCIDLQGNIVAPIIFYSPVVFVDGIALVTQDIGTDVSQGGTAGNTYQPILRYGFIDRAGKQITSCTYSNASNFSEGVAAVESGGSYKFIDKKGNTVLADQNYRFIGSFSEGLCMVKAYLPFPGLCGYINSKGEKILPPKYSMAWAFKEGVAHVEMDNKHGFIDKNGAEVIPFIYSSAGDCNYGVIKTEIDGKPLLVDKSGKIVVPLKYDYMEDFNNEGLAKVKLFDGGYYGYVGNKTDGLPKYIQIEKWGYIDVNGKAVIPVIYDKIESFTDGKAKAVLGSKTFYFDKTGKDLADKDVIVEKPATTGNEKLAADYISSGDKKFGSKNYKGAIADYNKATDLDPKNLGGYFNRAECLKETEDYSGAILDYDRILELYKDNPGSYFDRAECKYQLKNYAAAIKDYDKAIELYPGHVNAYFYRGISKMILNNYTDAIQDYSKVIELDPENVDAWYRRAVSKLLLKNYAGAIQDYTKVIALDNKNTDAWFNRGLSKRSLNKYADAIQDYSKVIELDPENVNAYINRGDAKYWLKDYAGCVRDSKKATELDPENGLAFSNLGEGKIMMNDKTGGCPELNTALKLGYTKAAELITKYCK